MCNLSSGSNPASKFTKRRADPLMIYFYTTRDGYHHGYAHTPQSACLFTHNYNNNYIYKFMGNGFLKTT